MTQLKGFADRNIGATRRVRAMYYRGFDSGTISSLTGLDTRTIHQIAEGDEDVSDTEYTKIRNALYHTFRMECPKGGTARQMQAKAERNGWSPFGAWANIDDPFCEPERLIDPDTEDSIIKIQILVARGFPLTEISKRSGLGLSHVHNIVNDSGINKLREPTVDKITRCFDELRDEPDPTGGFATRARNMARERGWDQHLEKVL